MRKLFVFAYLLLFSIAVHSQSVVQLRGDTVKAYKSGGATNFVLQDATKDSIGFMINIGNGLTRFVKPYKVGDSIFVGSIHFPVGSAPPPEDDNLDTILRRGGQLSANRSTNLVSFDWGLSGTSGSELIINDPVLVTHLQTNSTTYFERFVPVGYNGTTVPDWRSWSVSVQYDIAQPNNIVGSPWSWNYNPGGSRNSGSDAAFAFKTETNYYDQFEIHWPEIIDKSNVTHRVQSDYIAKTTGKVDRQMDIDQFSAYTAAGAHANNPWYTLQSTSGGGSTRETLGLIGQSASDATELKFYDYSATVGTLGGYVSVEHPGNGAGLYLHGFSAGLFIDAYYTHAPYVTIYDQTDVSGTGNVTYYGSGTSGKGFVFKSGAGDVATLIDGAATFNGRVIAGADVTAASYVLGVGFINNGGFTYTTGFTTVNATHTLTANESCILTTSGTFTFTLTTAAVGGGYTRELVFINNGSGSVTIDAAGSETIDGSLTKVLTAGQKARIKSDGVSAWYTMP